MVLLCVVWQQIGFAVELLTVPAVKMVDYGSDHLCLVCYISAVIVIIVLSLIL